MNRRLPAILGVTAAVILASVKLYSRSSSGLRSLRLSPFAVVTPSPRRRVTRSTTLFANLHQEREAYRIYRKQQDFEYAAFSSALDVGIWQDGVSVQFDASADPTARFTHRHRLVWDLFAPFYSCPSEQRVGTPPILFDGGKWLRGVQQLLNYIEYAYLHIDDNGKVVLPPIADQQGLIGKVANFLSS